MAEEEEVGVNEVEEEEHIEMVVVGVVVVD